MKIPIKFVWRKAYKQYFVIFPFFPFVFLEMGLVSLNQIFHIPVYVFYIPLFPILLIPLFVSFLKDYLSLRKFNFFFMSTVMVITNLMILYYYIHIAMEHEGAIRVCILSFMGLFYGTFLWDFFMGLSSINELHLEHEDSLKDFIINYKNNFPIYIDGSSAANSADSVFLPIKQKKRSVFLKVALIFSLPLLFLGKTGAYFFGIWLSNAFDIHMFLLSVIFWVLSLVFLAATSLGVIALWKLKYPTQEEVEAYKAEGKV